MAPGGLYLAACMTRFMNLKTGDIVLDIGCGRGDSAIFLAERFGDPDLVMILATGLRMAVSMAGDPSGRRFGQKFQGFPAGWPARGMISSTPAPGKPQSGCRCFGLGDACRAAR